MKTMISLVVASMLAMSFASGCAKKKCGDLFTEETKCNEGQNDDKVKCVWDKTANVCKEEEQKTK